jgi:hypothetical protein
MSHSLRYLRIAFSAFCGLVCVMLVVLWVRSYWQRDRLEGAWFNNSLVNVWSMQGQIAVLALKAPGHWKFSTTQIPAGWRPKNVTSKWGWDANSMSWAIAFPHFLIVAILAMSTAAPWLPQRFSLRTLLISMTVVTLIVGPLIAM